AQAVVLLLRAVAPLNSVGLAKGDDLVDPGEQFAILGGRFHGGSGSGGGHDSVSFQKRASAADGHQWQRTVCRPAMLADFVRTEPQTAVQMRSIAQLGHESTKTGLLYQSPGGVSFQFAQSRPRRVCEVARRAKHCRAQGE